MMNFILEKEFIPAIDSFESFQKEGNEEIVLTIKRGDSIVFPFRMKISQDFERSFFFVKKILLSLFWMVGGENIFYKGNHDFFLYFTQKAKEDHELERTIEEIEDIFDCKVSFFETNEEFERKDETLEFSEKTNGNRIGIDLGGSDRKVTAISNNEVIFSNETLWDPKSQSHSIYQKEGILDSINEAKKRLPSVDSIGFSTAGIVLNNELLFPSLYKSVSKEEQKNEARYVFKEIMEENFPNVPYVVLNDGDASAIGASMFYKKDHIMGLALGTSFAAGYAQKNHLITWINELSKTPINFFEGAREHYIFGIKGSASEYLSQKGLILLLEKNGLHLEGDLPIKLLKIQQLAKENNQLVLEAYNDLGIYLGSALRYYSMFYDIENVMLFGRVISGIGGEIIKNVASEYLKENNLEIEIFSGDEKFKRLGQSYAVALLPEVAN